MVYRMGACKGCKERREWLEKQASSGIKVVRSVVAAVKKGKSNGNR